MTTTVFVNDNFSFVVVNFNFSKALFDCKAHYISELKSS